MSLDIALHDALQHNLVLIGLSSVEEKDLIIQKLRSHYASAGKHLAITNLNRVSFYYADKDPETYIIEESQRYVRPLSFLLHKGAHGCVIKDSHAVMIKDEILYALSRDQQVIILCLNIDNPELHFEYLRDKYHIPNCSASSIFLESSHPQRIAYASYDNEPIMDRLF